RGDVQIDETDNHGRTALHIAAANGNIAMAKRLLDKKASVNARDNNNLTPLHLAAAQGNFHLFILLVSGGAIIDAKDHQNSTPLHIVAASKQNEGKNKDIQQIIALLIDEGADVNDRNQYLAMPLHLAMMARNKFIANLLIEHYGADLSAKDCNGRTPLMLAEELFAADTEWLSSLEKTRCTQEDTKNIEKRQESPLSHFSQHSFIYKRASSPSQGDLLQSPEKRQKVVKVLDAEVAPEVGFTVLNSDMNFLNASDAETIPNTNIPASNETALLLVSEAISVDSPETLELCIEELGYDFKDLEENTYLHLAVKGNSRNIIEFLLLKLDDSRLRVTNQQGKTPLMLAKELGNQEIIALLDDPQDLCATERSGSGLSLLNEDMLAEGQKIRENFIVELVETGNVEELRSMLFQHEVDIAKRYADGNTLLHIAVLSKCLDSVQFLLDWTSAGFIDIPNDHGKTALDLALADDRNSPISKKLQMEKNSSPKKEKGVQLWSYFKPHNSDDDDLAEDGVEGLTSHLWNFNGRGH
ncbi:MAG: ankyrin repeat domain-containing protein, partial [Gammaproteobacteria bacterium]|nr:ankyrin repeat domain-containing protein [Gammaproteobacteria bacterium]